jgi:hypothetical protein
MAVLEKPRYTVGAVGNRLFAFASVRRIAARLWVLLIVGALLAPIWTVRYPPVVDYPNHLASAFVLAHLNDPSFHFSGFYAADWNANPYLAMDVILVWLQRFMPIEIAGRVLLSLCVLAVPAAAWFFVRRANPEQESLALWSLAITQNLYFFLWGMLNLQLSLALCLLVLGFWLEYLERPRIGLWCLLLTMTTALYFTHLMGFGMAGWVMTAYAIFARRRIRDIFFSWILFIPGAIFFLHSTMPQAKSGWTFAFNWSAKVPGLLVAATSGISPVCDFVTMALLVVALGVASLDNRDFKCSYRWLGVVGSLFAFYWILPASLGPGINTDRRLIPFIFVLVLAVVRVGRRKRVLAAIAILLFVLRAGEVEYHFVSAQRDSARLAGVFSVIPDGMRVLPVATPSDHMQHFWAYGVIQRGWLSPCLFQNRGVQPLRTLRQNDSACAPIVNSAEPLEWRNVRHDFDYVWVYRVPNSLPSPAAIGKVVYEDGDLRVWQLN